MRYRRLPIEIESPEERGYGTIRNNLTESSVRDLSMADLGIDLSFDLPEAPAGPTTPHRPATAQVN